MANRTYRQRKAQGLCGHCGQVTPAPGRTLCQVCGDRQRLFNPALRLRRKDRGECPDCGQGGTGGLICPDYKARVGAATAASWHKKRQAQFEEATKRAHKRRQCYCCRLSEPAFLTFREGQVWCFNCWHGSKRSAGVCPHQADRKRVANL